VDLKAGAGMIETIQKDIYRIEIPLPNSPLKSINNYFIRGYDRNLWIDTAFDNPACRKTITEAISLLEVDFAKTDIFLTHKHEDHCGLVSFIATSSSKIFASESTVKMLQAGETSVSIAEIKTLLKRNTPIYGEIVKFHALQNEFNKREPLNSKFRTLRQGDVVSVGSFQFDVIETPGHIDGHLCLYDENRGIIFSGDHILGSIIPNITQWREEKDVIAEYFDSLDKIDKLQVNLVLPGHRKTFLNCHYRIEQLKSYHENRLHEIIQLFKHDHFKERDDLDDFGFLTTFDVASRMKWVLTNNSFSELSFPQYLFAIGETKAYLYHLQKLFLLESKVSDGLIYYYAADVIP
jgi:glyoxylase-like metal-dependent hydrolase (beta-lactamase superfamily II)